MEKKFFTTRNMIMIGMFTAILAVLSVLQIPTPSGVPFTLQTFIVALTGYVLGAKRGMLVILLYILLGTVGIPVFSGMKGGVGVLIGPTGGFIAGFLGLALLCGIGRDLRMKVMGIIVGILGLAVCHMAGALWFSVLMNRSIPEAFLMVSLPYLLKDVLSVAGAYLVGAAVRRMLLKSEGVSI